MTVLINDIHVCETFRLMLNNQSSSAGVVINSDRSDFVTLS